MNIDSKVVQIDTFLEAVVAGKIIKICSSPHPVNSEKHFIDEPVYFVKKLAETFELYDFLCTDDPNSPSSAATFCF
jgi:hypothetical protein